jgi:hypothetical protein
MAKAKESIKLKETALSLGGFEYKVLELINRQEPHVGDVLSDYQVSQLIMEARKNGSTLTVKIT